MGQHAALKRRHLLFSATDDEVPKRLPFSTMCVFLCRAHRKDVIKWSWIAVLNSVDCLLVVNAVGVSFGLVFSFV